MGSGAFLRRITFPDELKDSSILEQIPCGIGWIYSRITSDGHVIPCCKAYDMPLGNIHEHSFHDIWHGPAYSEFRRNARNLHKNQPYFDPISCFRACDNIGQIQQAYETIDNHYGDLCQQLFSILHSRP